ncbi:MAG: PEP-CTERM sorting domain-containing protein [Opitutales bacterium]
MNTLLRAGAGMLCALPVIAQGLTVDFESVAAGTTAESFTFNVSGTTVDVIRLGDSDPLTGSAGDAVNGDDLGIFFSGDADNPLEGGPDNGNDEDLFTAPFVGERIDVDMNGVETVTDGPVMLNLGNILVGNEANSNDNPDDDAQGSRFLFSFAPPAAAITELILIDTEDGEDGLRGGTVNAYSDINALTIVGSYTFDGEDGEGANNSGRIIAIEFGPGVTALEIILNGSGAVGEISFSAVPEPGAYAAIAGVLALGIAWMRRRRLRG